ncbi:hypothetical protein DV737_g2636, partial [Chaetothyriales sp. CBS 132003]
MAHPLTPTLLDAKHARLHYIQTRSSFAYFHSKLRDVILDYATIITGLPRCSLQNILSMIIASAEKHKLWRWDGDKNFKLAVRVKETLELVKATILLPPEEDGRNALLIASRHCHQEALAFLWTYVELNITDMISAYTNPHIPFPSPLPPFESTLPASHLLLMHNLHRLVLDGGTGGKVNDHTSAFLLSLCPSLTSVTLLCGQQYDVSLLKSDLDVAVFREACKVLVTRIVRASPWRVLGTKFWRPRKDLFGLMQVWKMRNGRRSV